MSFLIGCLYELALLGLALLWGWFFRAPVWRHLHGDSRDAWLGVAAAVPPLLFFIWSLKSELPVFTRHRQTMDSLLRPLFSHWSGWQLAVISVVAGISEEALFRGAIQASLAERIPAGVALALASALFGVSHLVTWTYAVIAAIIGAYLGLLWIWTGNLLTPMVTHAVYDFLALLYFLKVYRSAPSRR